MSVLKAGVKKTVVDHRPKVHYQNVNWGDYPVRQSRRRGPGRAVRGALRAWV
jgi:hypothetical protein